MCTQITTQLILKNFNSKFQLYRWRKKTKPEGLKVQGGDGITHPNINTCALRVCVYVKDM